MILISVSMHWRFFTVNYSHIAYVHDCTCIIYITYITVLPEVFTIHEIVLVVKKSRLTSEDCSLSLTGVKTPPTNAPPLILLPLPLILMCEAPPIATPSAAVPPATLTPTPPTAISLRLNFFLAPRCLKEWASVWPELDEEEEEVVGIIWGGGAPSLVALTWERLVSLHVVCVYVGRGDICNGIYTTTTICHKIIT